MIPELKAVYVDIVKAASESIRSALEERFHASWTQDFGQFAHPVLGRPQRSTTSYLTPDVLANYTFFTFVRDPRTRFRSAYALEDVPRAFPSPCRCARRAAGTRCTRRASRRSPRFCRED